ncbi:MAG: DUF354 domain-containing protein [bacterium]
MKILFFLVHPAKFHFHRVQINELLARGHDVEVLIIKKDILEDLVKEEGWEYTNIFPKGRKIAGLHIYLAAVFNIIRTVYRLHKYTRGRDYDLFVGDALTMLGRLKRVPSLYPTDDDLATVPQQEIFWVPAHHVIAPAVMGVGKYKYKSIEYDGYKALAHLHPNYFTPDRTRLANGVSNREPFFLIRLCHYASHHDIGRTGIGDEVLRKLVAMLERRGKILITSERALPKELEKYRMTIRKNDISHYLYFATLFISDSTTMSSEAAILGTPAIEFDNWWEELPQMVELHEKYQLIFGIKTTNQDALFEKVDELLSQTSDLKSEFLRRRDRLLADKIDVSAFLIWFMENYPRSAMTLTEEPDYQKRFKQSAVLI